MSKMQDTIVNQQVAGKPMQSHRLIIALIQRKLMRCY